MGFDKNAKYPFLIIESNRNELKSVDLSETENILIHLQNEGYITNYRSYSAKESQTLQ